MICPRFRNWQNEEHVAELARLWNVEPDQIPHWGPPTHAMEIFRYAEQGSIEFLWVSGTNPAVSLPDLGRIRAILSQESLFLVVSDAFLTETARLADVVLPAALWGEKTGTFTNTDRTVHLSEKAVEPPGLARPDGEIFADYARRLGLKDKDGQPLVKWSTPEECFEAWKECTRGRPCDYTGLSYDRLRGGTGIQWPCNDDAPDGTERLYSDLAFPTLAGRLRGLRPRHRHRRIVQRSRLQSAGSGRPRDPESCRVDSAARVGGRRLSVHAHDRPHRLPLPHSHENRAHTRTSGRRPRALGRAVPG